MSGVLAALAMAQTSLRQLLRYRGTVVYTLALPLLVTWALGVATGRDAAREVPIGYVGGGGGPLAAELRADLEASPLITLRHFDHPNQLRQAVRRGMVAGGVVMPADLDAQLRRGENASVSFVSDPSRGFPSLVRSAVAEVVTRHAGRLQAARITAERTGSPLEAALRLARDVEAETPRARPTVLVAGRVPPSPPAISGFAYAAPASLVLFVFVTSVAGSAQLVEARRLGVARRMAASPAHPAAILAGQALARFVIAAYQGLYVLVAGWLAFGVDFGDPAGAAAVVVAVVVAGTAAGMLCGALLKTPAQAAALGSAAGLAAGMLGGCLWPRSIMPTSMQRLGLALPHTYAMQAFTKLIARGSGITGITGELGALAAFSAVLLGAAVWRLARGPAGA